MSGREAVRTAFLWVHAGIGWPLYALCTAMVGVGIAVSAVFGIPRWAAMVLRLGWGRLLWTVQPFWRRTVLSSELNGEGPFIIVANHQSVLDIPWLFGLPLPIRVVARPGIFHVAVMGWFVRRSGQIRTDAFFEEASSALSLGYSVVVFPEGSRSTDGEVKRFRRGAFDLACRTRTPILPVAMDGAQKLLGKRGFFPSEVHVSVCGVVLEPILPGDDPRSLRDEVRNRVRTALIRIRANA